MKITEKTFLVTGGGSGIGKELVLVLLEKGANVVAVDVRDEALTELKKQAGEDAGSLSTHVLDITDKGAVGKLPDEVIASQGSIDGIINMAGIIQPFVKVNELDFKSIEKVMNVNFYGTLYMTKAFLPVLLRRPEAHIVNVSSMGGFLPVPGQSVYGASKAAVKLFTEGLYAELKDTNVGVSIVFPGATATNITKNSGVKVPEAPKSGKKAKEYPTLPANEAAKIIIRGIEKNKFQIFTGSDSKTMSLLYRLSPKFATDFISRKMKSLLKD
jgi:short-subunit dehydrogenase